MVRGARRTSGSSTTCCSITRIGYSASVRAEVARGARLASRLRRSTPSFTRIASTTRAAAEEVVRGARLASRSSSTHAIVHAHASTTVSFFVNLLLDQRSRFRWRPRSRGCCAKVGRSTRRSACSKSPGHANPTPPSRRAPLDEQRQRSDDATFESRRCYQDPDAHSAPRTTSTSDATPLTMRRFQLRRCPDPIANAK